MENIELRAANQVRIIRDLFQGLTTKISQNYRDFFVPSSAGAYIGPSQAKVTPNTFSCIGPLQLSRFERP